MVHRPAPGPARFRTRSPPGPRTRSAPGPAPEPAPGPARPPNPLPARPGPRTERRLSSSPARLGPRDRPRAPAHAPFSVNTAAGLRPSYQNLLTAPHAVRGARALASRGPPPEGPPRVCTRPPPGSGPGLTAPPSGPCSSQRRPRPCSLGCFSRERVSLPGLRSGRVPTDRATAQPGPRAGMQVAGPGAGDGPRPGGRRLTPEGEVGHPGRPQSTKDPAPRVLRTTPHARVCYICGQTPFICGKAQEREMEFPF